MTDLLASPERAERRTGRGDLPPGPRDPRTVQFLRWIFTPAQFAESAHRRWGELFTFRWPEPMGELVWVVEPQLVKQIFAGDPAIWRAGEANAIVEPIVGPRSLLRLDGAEHLHERRMLLPAFHGRRIDAYRDLIADTAHREIDTWPIGEPFALLPPMQRITLEVILRAVFGFHAENQLAESRDRIQAMMAVATDRRQMARGIWERTVERPRSDTELGRLLDAVDETLYEHIARARADERLAERDDVLAMMVQARDEAGEGLGDSALRDELMTMLIAGHETTANSLAWAWERLTRTPDALAELTAEARRDDGSAYTQAVVRETLRSRPVLWAVARVLAEPVELGGYELPAGVAVGPNIYLMHRRADLYPDPLAFRPERFLDSRPETFAWLPFGGGVRRCLGAAFAELEMREVLRAMASRCTLRADRPDHDEQPRRRGVAFTPSRGGRVVLEERRAA
jgi:cytochrome P450